MPPIDPNSWWGRAGATYYYQLFTTVDQAVTDTVALTETFVKDVGRRTADTVGLTEGLSALKSTLRYYSEAVGLTETFRKVIDKPVTDAVALTESLVKAAGKALAETVSLGEGFAISKVIIKDISDTVGLSEGLGTQVLGGGVSGRRPRNNMSFSSYTP